MPRPFEIGQVVRISGSYPTSIRGEFIVRHRNEIDSPEPNYLIESLADKTRRRESQSRLTAADAEAPSRE